MTAPVDLRYTDPLTGSGALDGTNVGVTDAVWADVVGAGTRGGTATTFSGAVSGAAFAAADFGMSDFDVQVKTHGTLGGDALYFRVADAINYWDIRQRQQVVSSGYYGPWYGTGWVLTNAVPQDGTDRIVYSSYVNGIPTVRIIYSTNPMAGAARRETQSVTRDWYSSSSTYRYLIVEKCVAGVVSTVASWQVPSFGVLRVSGFGDDIKWYQPDGLAVQGGVTDAFNNSATDFGFGVAGTDSTSYGSNLRDFVLQLPGSLVPPSIESPADGADVDISQPVNISVVSNYGPDNPLTNADIRWREQGAGSWNDVPNALAAPGKWLLPTAGMTAPVQIEMQVRGVDSFANQSSYSPSVFFTLRVAPAPPTFIAPPPGTVVVAADIATVDFGSDAVERQARRLGEDPNNPGVPDLNTVYEDGLTLTPTDTPGIYDLAGDGDIHPSGPEVIQARRRTTAGGSMWSGWASLPVVMSLARPYPPTVTYTLLPDDAAVAFRIEPTPGDVTHPDGTELVVVRGGVPVHRVQAGVEPIEWVDKHAHKSLDYEFRLAADNGGVVVVT